MQEQPARIAARMNLKNLAAELTQMFKPCAEVFRQLRINLAAEALGDGGAFAGGGDGYLQIATADDGAKKEIAVGNVVDAVARDVSSYATLVDGCIHIRRIGGGDDQEIAIEVGVFKAALDPFQSAFDR